MFRKLLHPQVLSLSSDCPLLSPAEDGGLFFEINRGFLDSEIPGMTENRPTMLKTGIKEHSFAFWLQRLHWALRASALENIPSSKRQDPNLTKEKGFMI